MGVNLLSVTEKLQNTDSLADAKNVLEWIRMNMCNGATYQRALEMCVHYDEDIISRRDAKYPILEKEVWMLLEGKDKNQQIFTLSEMIIAL